MRWRSVAAAIGSVLWVVVPLVAAAAVLTRADHRTNPTPPDSTWTPIGPPVTSIERSASLLLTWATGPPLVAPQWSGLVERVDLAPGQAVTSGQSVGRVGGSDRLLVASAAPFTRPLQVDDVGSDVADLNTTLASLGLPAGGADRYTTATLRGVRALSRQLVGAEVDTFDPNWFVFTPSASVLVASVEFVAGAPAPSAGSVLATSRAVLTSATLSDPVNLVTQSRSVALESRSSTPAACWIWPRSGHISIRPLTAPTSCWPVQRHLVPDRSPQTASSPKPTAVAASSGEIVRTLTVALASRSPSTSSGRASA